MLLVFLWQNETVVKFFSLLWSLSFSKGEPGRKGVKGFPGYPGPPVGLLYFSTETSSLSSEKNKHFVETVVVYCCGLLDTFYTSFQGPFGYRGETGEKGIPGYPGARVRAKGSLFNCTFIKRLNKIVFSIIHMTSGTEISFFSPNI